MTTVLFSLIIIPFIAFFIYKNNIRRHPNLFSSFSLAFLIYYTIIPLVVFILSETNTESKKFFSEFYGRGGMSLMTYYFFVITFYMVFLLSYQSAGKRLCVINEKKFLKYLRIVGRVTLVVGGLSFVAYIYFLGGFVKALAIAEYARAFGDMTTVLNSWQIMLLTPARLLSLPAFCFIFLYEDDKKKEYKLCFILSVVLLFGLYLFEASRSSLMILVLTLGIPFLRKFTKRPWLIIIIAAILGMNMLNILDMLFASYSTGEFGSSEFNVNELIAQFSFASRNAMYSLEIVGKYGVRWGQDFITSFINYIPGIATENSIEPTSRFWGGDDWKSGVPNDVITFSILEFHVLGLIIYSFILGKILKVADNSMFYLSKQKKYKYAYQLFSTVLMLTLFFYIPSADISSLLLHFTLLVFIYILIVSKKVTVLRG